ncbi:hypothetical protein L618_003400000020 [Rhodococcus rhodochrous J45]|uniref:Uncharacterized protein n=1 Tax=Rhodococcus rhodochrous J45 TaxID=935266 RepID=A0A562DZE2_RHORH|nr:hypothetical protein [Rhodococcus rhodochrous]TWH14986.1 hypothetical protein L618_003400000020 [Rhodococcus rhodochrous J45]
MIEAELYVQYGSTLPFQQVGLPMPDLPAATTHIITWDSDQRLLVIRTGTPLGAVAFRSEVLPEEPAVDESGWDEWQEISVQFDSDDVRLRDLEADTVLLGTSLISMPGRYRVRLYATGRDSGVELQEAGDDLVERYLMQLWPESEPKPMTSLVRVRQSAR